MQKANSMISKTVWILALVSLFADIASEMLYPVVPVYLKQTGFSVALIGILEGVAEFTVGLSKGYFGKRSDDSGKRLPFVRTGYFLSAVSKPMMAVLTYPWWIFLARVTDRLGKGIRTAARDAVLSAQSEPHNRARIFGFHRAWDTTGAILGPFVTLIFIQHYPGNYTSLFYWALIPGLIAVILLFLLKESTSPLAAKSSGGFFSYFSYWKEAGKSYHRLITPLLIFAVANSSDAFLLLQAKNLTGSDVITISAYIFYNIVYALAAYPMGVLADRWGYRKVMTGGLIAFCITYVGFAFVSKTFLVYVLFFIYGIYAAATEGLSKAWISNLANPGKTATAIGLYTSAQSICTLLSSTIAGLLWTGFGPAAAFGFSALLALIALLALALRKF